jgi:hypothetical protein
VAALATFAVTYVSTGRVVTGLGILGLIACGYVVGLSLLFVVVGGRSEGWLLFLVNAFIWVVCLAGVTWIPVAINAYLAGGLYPSRFGVLQTIGLFYLVMLVVVAYFEAVRRHREKHKTCPDCANVVLRAARVCQFCGYRWAAPE